ncbi:MAG: ABC transporter substrate-binding protein [Polyangiaceae bacterium]
MSRNNKAISILSSVAVFFSAACTRGHRHPENKDASTALACSCASPPPPPRFVPNAVTEAPVPSDRGMIVQLDAEPPNLMPTLRPDWMSHVIVSHLIEESLLRIDPKSGAAVPELAESWSADATKTRWTFHLRKGVRWHDGEAFTADDVVFTFQRVADPAVGASDRALFSGASAKVADPLTVVVTLRAPLGSPEVAFDRLLILARHRSPRGDLGESPDATAPIGTGPMRFVSWARGATIELARFDDYWGARPPLATMTFRFPPTYGRVLEELQEGDVDVVPRAPNDAAAAVEKDPVLAARYDVVRAGGASYTAWIHNVASKKLADPRVRRAIGLSVPRDRLRCEVEACNVSIALGPLPADHAAMQGVTAPAFDPALAARDLDDAGIIDHDGDGVREQDGIPFSLRLIVPTTSTEQERIASVVSDQLRKIGVRLEVMPLEWSQFRRALESHDFELAAIEWTIDAEPDLFPLFHSTETAGSLNYGAYSSHDVDRALEEQRRGGVGRVESLHEVTMRIRGDEPYTFLFSPLIVAIVKKGSVNVAPTPLGWDPRSFGWR